MDHMKSDLTFGNRTVRFRYSNFCDLQQQAARIFNLPFPSEVGFKCLDGTSVPNNEILTQTVAQSETVLHLLVFRHQDEAVPFEDRSTQTESLDNSNTEPSEKSGVSKKKIIGAVVGGTALAVAAPFAVVGAVGALGFGAGGIAGGSIAASMMSSSAIASGGGVAAGGLVATLQSIGAAGLGAAGIFGSAATGATVGATLGTGVGAAADAMSKKDKGEDNATNNGQNDDDDDNDNDDDYQEFKNKRSRGTQTE